MKLTKPWTPEIFLKCYCVARNKPIRCEITKPQTATVIILWFWGLLACAELYCDWPIHNQHSRNFSGVHSFLSLTVTSGRSYWDSSKLAGIWFKLWILKCWEACSKHTHTHIGHYSFTVRKLYQNYHISVSIRKSSAVIACVLNKNAVSWQTRNNRKLPKPKLSQNVKNLQCLLKFGLIEDNVTVFQWSWNSESR